MYNIYFLMTLSVKSMYLLCKKLIRIIVVQKKFMYFGFVASNLFIWHFHLHLNPFIPHSN